MSGSTRAWVVGGGAELWKHMSGRRTGISADPTQGTGAAVCSQPTHAYWVPRWILDCFGFMSVIPFLS